MNPSDDRLNRLLEAAQGACPPEPEPSPWFEQRVLAALKEQAPTLSSLIDGRFLFRILAGGALVMAFSAILPLVQVKNPYLETMELANTTTVQMEKNL